jgi:hypothetical protein
MYNISEKGTARWWMPPEWLFSQFGKDAIWYNESLKHFFVTDELSESELHQRNVTERGWLTGYQKILHGSTAKECAVEMLGFIQLGIDEPYMYDSILRGPSFGTATLKLTDPGHDSNWECVSRALYENWRQEPRWLRSYWTIVFLCPCSASSTKNAILAYPRRLKAELVAYGQRRSFAVKFAVERDDLNNKAPPTKIATSGNNKYIGIKRSQQVMNASVIVVCGAIPYTSSDPRRVPVNKALLVEWINYYSQLGMHIHLYDRDGASKKYIQSSRHEKKLGNIKKSVAYFDYTMKGLLDKAAGALKMPST